MKNKGSLWLKTSGTLKLKDGRKIKAGEKFYEFKNNIPAAFLKSLQLLESEPKAVAAEKKNGNESGYELKQMSTKRFNVVGPNGKLVSEKNLPLADAEKLLAALLGDEEAGTDVGAGADDEEDDDKEEGEE